MQNNRTRKRRRGALAVCLGGCAMTACWGQAVLEDTDTAITAPGSDATGFTPTTGDDGPEDPGTTGAPDPTGATDPTGDPDCVAQREAARQILTDHCAACHSGPGAQVFDYVTDLDALVAQGKVEGGDPENSQLYQLIDTDVMPKTVEKLTTDEKLVIRAWIDECTAPEPGGASILDPPACVGINKFISIDEMLARMHAGLTDLTAVDPGDEPNIRFFTLTHLWNAGYCDSQIDAYRHGLAKLVNSLSNQPAITLPVAVDPERTMYRIDLRDYGWNTDLWDLLVDRNPFAVQYLQQTAVGMQLLTDSAVPFQTADWFVTDAAQAPLYDQLLYERVFALKPDIFAPPLNRAELEAFLGVDVAGEVNLEAQDDPGDVARAGFQLSGVSKQNRVIERHAFLDNFTRPYWLSHDFLSNAGTGNIFAHPLDFVADGGEIIWTLPNGLQGYMLVDGAGERVSVADVNIVSNEEQNGDPIINGVSCMGCHYQGMRTVVDEISPYIASHPGLFTAIEQEKIFNLYPEPDEFAAGLTQDSDVFVASVNKTGAPPLIDGHEVTSLGYLAFEDTAVDLRRAAAELNLTAEALTPQVGNLPIGMQMISSGFINRDSMRADYAQAVCNLKLGITRACPPG